MISLSAAIISTIRVLLFPHIPHSNEMKISSLFIDGDADEISADGVEEV